MNLPTHPREYDNDQLEKWLNAPAGNLIDFQYEKIGSGQVADCYRITLNWTNLLNLPASIVAKCPAADPVSLETAKNFKLYDVETDWYKNFAIQSRVRVPTPYFVALNEDDLSQFILLLEDCHPAYQIDQYKGCSIEDVEKILKEATLLHKFKWGDPSLETSDKLNNSKKNQEFVRELLPAIFPEFSKRYKDRLDPNILEMGKQLMDRYSKYSAEAVGPFALCHGDMRLDNILMGGEDGRAILLDWQTFACGKPLSDIAYCISTSILDPDVRASNEHRLVSEYVVDLDLPEDAFTFDQAWHDYRFFSFSGFLMALISSMLVERTERGDEMFAVMAERSGYQALHLDALSLI